MRVIIAGSRGIRDPAVVDAAVAASGFVVTEVVSGEAKGVDRLGEDWAVAHQIPVRRFPADWEQHGRRAGFLRNTEMAEYAAQDEGGGLVAVWDGQSRGTMHMIDIARRLGLKVHVATVPGVAVAPAALAPTPMIPMKRS